MTKHEISNLLRELKSDETFIRNDAIKKIIKNKIDKEQIVAALKDVIKNDSSMSVRNFARGALDVFGIKHSAMEEPIVKLHKNEIHIDSSKIGNEDANPDVVDSAQHTLALHAPQVKTDGVNITSTNAIFGERNFVISDITSVSVFQPKIPVVLNIIAFILGLAGSLIILASCAFSINFDLAGLAIFGLLLIGTGKYITSPTYGVEIVISSEKIIVFESKQYTKCKRIVDALNEAISNKSTLSGKEFNIT